MPLLAFVNLCLNGGYVAHYIKYASKGKNEQGN